MFEIGKRGAASDAAEVMRKQRAKLEPKHRNISSDEDVHESKRSSENRHEDRAQSPSQAHTMEVDTDEELVLTRPDVDMDEASEADLELTFTSSGDPNPGSSESDKWRNQEHYMAYAPSGVNLPEDRGFGVHSGSNSNFLDAARSATMDLANDETKAFGEASRPSGLRWDKKSKKYVSRANDEDGSKGKKMMTSESGQKVPASLRSGRYDAWRKANKVGRLPKVGELEQKGLGFANPPGRRFKHKMVKAPKEADRYRDDYHKQKKRVGEAKEKRIGRFAEGKGKNELKGVDDVRKARKLKAKRREKNARPSRRT